MGQSMSLAAQASAELDFVVFSLWIVGLVNVTGVRTLQGKRAGNIYYQFLPDNALFGEFDTPSSMISKSP